MDENNDTTMDEKKRKESNFYGKNSVVPIVHSNRDFAEKNKF